MRLNRLLPIVLVALAAIALTGCNSGAANDAANANAPAATSATAGNANTPATTP